MAVGIAILTGLHSVRGAAIWGSPFVRTVLAFALRKAEHDEARGSWLFGSGQSGECMIRRKPHRTPFQPVSFGDVDDGIRRDALACRVKEGCREYRGDVDSPAAEAGGAGRAIDGLAAVAFLSKPFRRCIVAVLSGRVLRSWHGPHLILGRIGRIGHFAMVPQDGQISSLYRKGQHDSQSASFRNSLHRSVSPPLPELQERRSRVLHVRLLFRPGGPRWKGHKTGGFRSGVTGDRRSRRSSCNIEATVFGYNHVTGCLLSPVFQKLLPSINYPFNRPS